MRADDFFRELEAENSLSPDAAAEIDAPYILARNVYKYRKALDLSQAGLAEALGVSQPRIAKIERGDANLRIGTVARLAVVLGCEISDLLSNERSRAVGGAETVSVAASIRVRVGDSNQEGDFDLSSLAVFVPASNDNFALAA